VLRSATREASRTLRRSFRLNGTTPSVQNDTPDYPINAILTTHLHICNRAPLASGFSRASVVLRRYVSSNGTFLHCRTTLVELTV
jgi:hypothetical protein